MEKYISKLSEFDTQNAIALVKEKFSSELCAALDLSRVSAPLFVKRGSGINDDLNGVERPVDFDIKETGEIAGVISIDQDPKVESLTCWTPELQPGRELSRLGVRETYQNQGIARKLMAGAMEELRRQGFKSVHILVAKENKKALASYKVFEYETVGECFLHEHDYWCYEKAL